MFFQVGLLRATGMSGMGLAGGWLLRDLLKLTLNPGRSELAAPGVEVVIGEVVLLTVPGSACVIADRGTVVSSPKKIMVERMYFMILGVSVAGQDKIEVTFCTVSSSDRTELRSSQFARVNLLESKTNLGWLAQARGLKGIDRSCCSQSPGFRS
jgi:hypothetical protein